MSESYDMNQVAASLTELAILRRNVQELQKQLNSAYRRIDELLVLLDARNTK